MKNSTRSLHEVIESTVELAAPRASDKGLSLICRMHPTCKDLFTFDAWCITQLLSNLLSNALQYTDCGRVMVSVSCEDIDGLEGYRIVVEDSGPGIAAPIREAMFALPDQREHMSDHESMGYGMLISRQLAHMIGATLEIDSAADRGTRVTVAGPANHMVDGQQKTGIIASALRDTQALIVDSDMAARRVLEAHLRSWGVDVRSVLDVASAFDRIEETAAREQTISMVFVSSNVSDEDMRILVGGLSEDPRCRDVMLVSIDHSNPVDTAMSCLHASSNPRLPTPIKPNELFDCVAQHPFVSSQSLHLGEPSVENPASETLRRVLLVEDNIVNQCVASEILKRIGVQVDIANNGVEALQRLGAGHYDFVFMDCQMPEMDGFQATQEIRQRGDLNDLPVVALTANALSGDRQRCLDAGMNDYLTKPFSKAQLEKMLEKWIGPPADQSAASITMQTDAADDALVDSDALAQIRMLDVPGESSIFDEIIDEYLRSSSELVQRIAESVSSADYDAVRRDAHSLKSSSAAVGLAIFSKHCAQLERLGDNADIEGIKHCWSEASDCYQRSLSSLQSESARRVA